MTEFCLLLLSPNSGAAANQQPLLIVYKQSMVRPAAFKSPCSLIRADKKKQLPLKLKPTRTF